MLNLFLNVITVYLTCSIFENLFLFFIVYFALIIINCEVLSLFCAYNAQNILLLSFLEFIAALLIFLKIKKKLYIPKFDKKILNALKLDKNLIIFCLFFIFMLCCLFVPAAFSPPLEPDSRMYHFVRIFHYIKQGSFNHFEINEVRNIIMPFNSEMIYSYFFVFKKNDLGFGILSYISFLFAISGIYQIFGHIHIPIRKRLFAIFSLSSFGIVLVQIPSLQTDILIACFIISSIAFFMKYCKENKMLYCYFSSLSYALALGTKTTSIILIPAFLIIIFSYLKITKINFSKIAPFIIYLIINFAIFSSYNYILNFIQFGNFITNEMLKYEHLNPINFKRLVYNATYLIGDFIGFKVGFLGKCVSNLQNSIIGHLGMDAPNIRHIIFDERTVGFSFAGIFIFIPCLIFSFFNENKRYFFIKICSLTFLINFAIIIFIFRYSPYIIRYFATFFMISAFCLVFGYRKIYKHIIIFLLCCYLALYSLFCSRCPLKFFFGVNIFNKNELIEHIMLKKQQDFYIYSQYKFAKEFLKNFKKEDKIAVINHDNFYELKKLSVLGYNIDTLTSDYFNENNILNYDYIIFYKQYSTYQQEINNYKKDEINKLYKKDYYCKHYVNQDEDRFYPVMKICHFNEDLINKKGFKLYKRFDVENLHYDVYKKLPN